MGIDDGEYEGARQALEHSLTIARREGDRALEVRTLGYAARVAGMHLHLNESLQRCLEVLALADKVDEPRATVDAAFWASLVSYCSLGDTDAGARHAQEALATAEKLGDRYRLGNSIWINETGYRLRGDWSAARGLSDRCMGITGGDPRPIMTRAMLEFETGAFAEGAKYLEALKIGMRVAPRLPTWNFATVAMVIPIIDRVCENSENFSLAEEAAELLLMAPSTLTCFTYHARTGLALISVHKGDPVLARNHYSAMRSGSGLLVPGKLAADRLLGLLAQTMGDPKKAAGHFEDALAFCRKAGYRPELAWTCCDYADLLLKRNGEGDRAKAMALLDESLAISSELGMRPLMERVLSRREILSA